VITPEEKVKARKRVQADKELSQKEAEELRK